MLLKTESAGGDFGRTKLVHIKFEKHQEIPVIGERNFG